MWYVSNEGEVSGPYSPAEMREEIRAKRVRSGMHVRDEGGAWSPLEASPFAELSLEHKSDPNIIKRRLLFAFGGIFGFLLLLYIGGSILVTTETKRWKLQHQQALDELERSAVERKEIERVLQSAEVWATYDRSPEKTVELLVQTRTEAVSKLGIIEGNLSSRLRMVRLLPEGSSLDGEHQDVLRVVPAPSASCDEVVGVFSQPLEMTVLLNLGFAAVTCGKLSINLQR
jgi:hypothetical protein